MRRRLLPLALCCLLPGPAIAADLVVAKAATAVADPLGNVRPRMLPGATVDYALTVTNPLANGVVPVKVIRNVEVVDTIAPALRLSLADLGAAGSGPVEFTDGGLLGLLGSGLALAGVDYSSDGVTWGYQPVPAGGFDARVRAIRVRLSGTQTAGGSFRLRYRTAVR